MNAHASTDPMAMFETWLGHATRHPDIAQPRAMCLGTANMSGFPSVRMMNLHSLDERGFVFYTNAKSLKGEDMASSPRAALCFYWMPLNRQVRVEGQIEIVTNAESDAYFATRSRKSQIIAWASQQSKKMESRQALEERIFALEATYEGIDVPRPKQWTGYRVVPDTIEFWIRGVDEMDDRWLFRRNVANQWEKELLYP